MLLHRAADERLDQALTTLPALLPDPQVELPYMHAMSDPLYGTGWHARIHTADAGWHRWTGPGTHSELRLPVRLAGPARVEVRVLSACDDDVRRSLRLHVQGRPVAHLMEPREVGAAAIAEVHLDPRRAMTLSLDVSHTAHLLDAASGSRSAEHAGLAIGTVSVMPPESEQR
jgi:hypothetical protein